MATFYAYPLNYGGSRSQHPAVADNNYQTFTDETSMLLNIDSAGDAREFTDIFVKGTGIASYTAAFTNGANLPSPSPFPRTLPETVRNDSGDTVETIVDGYQHDLFSLWDETQDPKPPKPQAKSVTLTFTGTSPRIYEVMILDRLLTLDSDGGFSRLEYDSLDLGSNDADLRGRLSYIPPIGGERDKWICNLTLFAPRRTSDRGVITDRLLHFIRNYKHFVFAPEYNRYPDRVFPAVWNDVRTAVRYISRWKGAGRRVSFGIREA